MFLIQITQGDVIKWKHFPRHWPFVWGIHRSPMNSPHKGQCRGVLMFSLIWAWKNCWVNNCEAGDLKRHCGHYDVIVMINVSHFKTCNPVLFPLVEDIGCVVSVYSILWYFWQQMQSVLLFKSVSLIPMIFFIGFCYVLHIQTRIKWLPFSKR